jgi:hypothetical protein
MLDETPTSVVLKPGVLNDVEEASDFRVFICNDHIFTGEFATPL